MSATTNCPNGSLLTLIVNICVILLSGQQCRINNSESESVSESRRGLTNLQNLSSQEHRYVIANLHNRL